jgi:hypothetical protein
VFLRQSHTLLLLVANLAIVGKLEANGDMMGATVAVKSPDNRYHTKAHLLE